MRRDSTPGRPVINVPSPYTRSPVRCGREVCPPWLCSVSSMWSAADVIGPARTATRPTASRGSQCSAKMRDTPFSAPAAIASIAPPGINSSAAWKISRTADRQLGHRRQRERRAEQHRGMRVVAAGVRNVRHDRGVRRPGPIGHRQRVHVGPQRDARPVLGAEVADQAGAAGQHLRVEAGVGQVRRDELRGGELLPPELRVGVDVPAPRHHVVVVGGQPAFGGSGEFHDATRSARQLEHPIPLGGCLGQR